MGTLSCVHPARSIGDRQQALGEVRIHRPIIGIVSVDQS